MADHVDPAGYDVEMRARQPRYRDILRARRPSPIFSTDPEHDGGSDTDGPDDQVAGSATVTDIGSRRSSP
ncbi:hypothetical protein FB388_0922 [Pseudonocardia cypriaca]|uniref:Uncharacterized protein n=1 Tax=Pseudonocardia cypriaca TaxID=882449 RepID=A0A543GBW4_9PSEU|nr:hypothetical protein FB388_0922 [Pseudonocardia cypriaca]